MLVFWYVSIYRYGFAVLVVDEFRHGKFKVSSSRPDDVDVKLACFLPVVVQGGRFLSVPVLRRRRFKTREKGRDLQELLEDQNR
jgi:hypothetical protein